MDTQGYYIPPSQPRKSPIGWIFLFVAPMVLLGVFSYIFFYTDFFRAEQKAPANFSVLLEEDSVFKSGIENIRSGKSLEGRTMLEQNIANVRQPEVVGVYQLWIASSFRFEDPKQYAQRMTNVATGPLFDKRTRLYAYAFLGDFYSAAPGNEVLDSIVNEESLKPFQVRKNDGAIDYRLTFTRILQNASQTLGDNPLVLARTASIILGGLRLDNVRIEESFTFNDVDALIARAIPLESDLLQTDTAPLYSSYLFLLAQVVGWTKLEVAEHSLPTIDALKIDDLYARAINISSTGNKPIEASARINYALYVIESHEKAGEEKDKEVAYGKIGELMKPFENDTFLQESPIMHFFSSAKSRSDISSYNQMKKLGEYSPLFRDLMESKNAF